MGRGGKGVGKLIADVDVHIRGDDPDEYNEETNEIVIHVTNKTIRNAMLPCVAWFRCSFNAHSSFL